MPIARHEELLADFRDRISSGDWPAGAQVPSEAQLCRESGTSRGPVRRALSVLRDEGLITGGQGKSPIVRKNVPDQSMSALGSFTAWAESAGHRVGNRTIEVAKRHAGARLAELLQVDCDDLVVHVTRVRLLDGEPVMLEHLNFIMDAGRPLLDWDTDQGSINRHLIAAGVDLFSSNHQLDAVAADAQDAELLGVVEGGPLLRAARTTSDSAGRIVEASEDRYVPGKTTISINNTLVADFGPRLRLA